MELMLQVRSGDRGALEILVRRHQTQLLRIAYKYLGDLSQAEDIVQQTFIRVLQSAGRYKPIASFKTWLCTIAINLCRNAARSSFRNRTLPLEAADPEAENPMSERLDPSQPTPEEILVKEDVSVELRSALRSLPEGQREAIVLREFGKLSYREIAEVLQTTEKAVDSLLFRARNELRVRLSPHLAESK